MISLTPAKFCRKIQSWTQLTFFGCTLLRCMFASKANG